MYDSNPQERGKERDPREREMARELITALELPLGSLLAAAGGARAYSLASHDLYLHPGPGRQRH
jgi:hypothetical protein